MSNKPIAPSLVILEESPNNETTYIVDKCLVKTKYLTNEESATSKANLENIRSVLFSALQI